MTVTNSTQIKQNSASDDGGGVYNNHGAALQRCGRGTLSNNTAVQDGGGVFNATNATLGASNSTFSGKLATPTAVASLTTPVAQ